MMIIRNGKVVYHFGNLAENSYIASCRKSLLALLYGKYVLNGTIATLTKCPGKWRWSWQNPIRSAGCLLSISKSLLRR
ncbi:MAG TPA: hypothetical protein VK668_14945 [Mucilaginibacter sp.]|nr:hypothetical protein [Mucilaginibacter sp.]